ncbi:ankyrin repeat-containing domain protein [Apiospora sp. TS-2023a]
MACSNVHNIYDLPPELLVQITQYLSFQDHARLLPLGAGAPGLDEDNATQTITRQEVVRWAVEHGSVGTLKNVEEVEDMASFLGTTLTSSVASLELTLIHRAALGGHALFIDYLLQKGADVNASTENDLLPMHLAKTGEVVHLLADHGGRLDHDETASSGVSALVSSISRRCEASAVAAFLELGADPNQVDRDGRTIAEVTILHGNVDALRTLVDSGVDVNKPLPSGGSLLYMAIWIGARDHGAEMAKTMATMLLDRGASPNPEAQSFPPG